MKSPFYALALIVLAGFLPSCIGPTETNVPGAGYTEQDAYDRGYSDGSSDRLAGRAHNPHINDPETLPSAYRKQYLWGYAEGYKNPYSRSRGSK